MTVVKKVNPITGERDIRVCRDYKPINAVTKPKVWPTPRIDKILPKLTKYKYYIAVDVTSAYFHIKVREKDRKYLTFATSKGQFTPIVMPFGPIGVPAEFNAAMKQVLGRLSNEPWLTQYFDDITIGGNSKQELISQLRQVLDKFRKSNLKIKLTKCEWYKEEINVLGWTVSQGRIRPQKAKIEPILKWEWPKSIDEIKKLETFMGKVTYIGKFIPKLAELAKPIREVIHKKRILTDKDAVKGFNEIKRLITEEQHIGVIDQDKPITIWTDASDYAIGATITQKENGKDIPRGYCSYTLSPSETKWTSMVRKEALAVRKAIEHFRTEIQLHQPGMIIIKTDSRDLYHILNKNTQHIDDEIMKTKKEVNMIFAKVEHISGKDNIIADCMSRMPLTSEILNRRKEFWDDKIERTLGQIRDLPYIVKMKDNDNNSNVAQKKFAQ
jgi:hypothetical protein